MKHKNSLEKYSNFKKTKNSYSSFDINKFEKLKCLCKNQNVEIYKVRKKVNNKKYLLKIRSKFEFSKSLIKIDCIKREKEIYEKLNELPDCNFIVPLYLISHSSKYIFYLYDYVSGGDLKDNLPLIVADKSIAIEILAEILLQIEFIHKHNIVHRDIKSENFMCDPKGHPLMIDFDLSASKLHNLEEFVGTVGYIAPEIKTGKYDYMVDFYSFGVLAFELLSNCDVDDLKKKLKTMDDDEKDFISRLTEKNPLRRLGINGIDDIKKHKFFKNINWSMIPSKNLLFKPKGSDMGVRLNQSEWFKGISYTHPNFHNKDI